MARSREYGTKYDKAPEYADNVWFADIRLNDVAQEECSRWALDNETDLTLLLTNLVDAGWRFTLKTDKQGGGALCSTTMLNKRDPSNGCCVTSRATSADVALWFALYKLVVLVPNTDLLEHKHGNAYG